MKTEERARFARIGEKGEKALAGRTVAIAGLGGMGTAACVVFARENIDLRLVDRGRVEDADMHRLSLFCDEDVAKFKVKQAKLRLAALNPALQVKSFHEELSASTLFLLQGDVIVDTSNNPDINRIILDYATGKKLPLVLARCSGSAYKVLVLQKKPGAKLLAQVAMASIGKEGIFGPVATIAGSVVAGETLKVLLGEKGSYLVEGDVWAHKAKVTKV